MMREKFKTAWAVFLSLAIVQFSICTVSARAAVKKGSDETQIQRMESRLNEEARKLSTFRSKEAHLLNLVAELEKQVADTKKETEALTLNVREVSGRLDAQKEKLKKLKAILEQTELQIGEYLRSLYKYSRRGNFRILANAHAIGELQRRIKYVGIVTQKDRENLHSLTDRASGLSK
jgi:septal ring factor EnvC (AmiA/AmiB activator)